MRPILTILVEGEALPDLLQALLEETEKQCGKEDYQLVNTIITQQIKPSSAISMMQPNAPQFSTVLVAVAFLQLRDNQLSDVFMSLMPEYKKVIQGAAESLGLGEMPGIIDPVKNCYHKWNWTGMLGGLATHICEVCWLRVEIEPGNGLPETGYPEGIANDMPKLPKQKGPSNSGE